MAYMNHVTKHSPGPYYVKDSGISRVVHDLHGRRLAELFPDPNYPERQEATERLFQMAPTILQSLRMATAILRQAGGHEALVDQLQDTLDAVEPQAIDNPANRLVLAV